jgi:hypothetical protein
MSPGIEINRLDKIRPSPNFRYVVVQSVATFDTGNFGLVTVTAPPSLIKSSPNSNAPHSELSNLRDPSIYRPTATWRHHEPSSQPRPALPRDLLPPGVRNNHRPKGGRPYPSAVILVIGAHIRLLDQHCSRR